MRFKTTRYTHLEATHAERRWVIIPDIAGVPDVPIIGINTLACERLGLDPEDVAKRVVLCLNGEAVGALISASQNLLQFLSDYPHQYQVDISGHIEDVQQALRQFGG